MKFLVVLSVLGLAQTVLADSQALMSVKGLGFKPYRCEVTNSVASHPELIWAENARDAVVVRLRGKDIRINENGVVVLLPGEASPNLPNEAAQVECYQVSAK